MFSHIAAHLFFAADADTSVGDLDTSQENLDESSQDASQNSSEEQDSVPNVSNQEQNVGSRLWWKQFIALYKSCLFFFNEYMIF